MQHYFKLLERNIIHLIIIILLIVYHLARIQAFIEHTPALVTLRQLHTLGRLTIEEAEAILIAREEKGVRQICEGTYVFESRQTPDLKSLHPGCLSLFCQIGFVLPLKPSCGSIKSEADGP